MALACCDCFWKMFSDEGFGEAWPGDEMVIFYGMNECGWSGTEEGSMEKSCQVSFCSMIGDSTGGEKSLIFIAGGKKRFWRERDCP